MTSAQLSEWEAYDRLDPVGSWRDDFRTASLMAHIVNVINALYAAKGATPKVSDPMDYMPNWDGEKRKKKQSVEEMKELLLGIAKNQNKNVAKEKNREKKLHTLPVKLQKREEVKKDKPSVPKTLK